MKAVLPVVLAAQFVVPMSISGTALALPVIAGDLGTDPTPLQWVVNGFNIAFALFTVVWGAVSDRIGHRTSFRIGVVLTAVASAVSAVAPSLYLLDVARVFAGIGAAAVLVGSTSILSLHFHGAARATAFALFGTVNGLGLALGPTISGLLVAAFEWRGVFAAQAVVLAAAAIGTVALPALRTESTAHRLLDFSLLRNRRFLALCLVPVAGAIGFVTLLTYLPAALSAVVSLTPGLAGVFMLAMTIPVLLAPLTVARLSRMFDAITPTRVVLVSLGCLVLGNLGMLALQPGVPLGAVVVPMIALGLGFGLPIGLVDGEAGCGAAAQQRYRGGRAEPVSHRQRGPDGGRICLVVDRPGPRRATRPSGRRCRGSRTPRVCRRLRARLHRGRVDRRRSSRRDRGGDLLAVANTTPGRIVGQCPFCNR